MLYSPSTPPVRRAPPVFKIAQGLINAALVIWALRDIRQRRTEEIKGNRKLWLMAAFTPPVGPIAYFLFGRRRDAAPAEIQLESVEQP